jgi:hypothetical protein
MRFLSIPVCLAVLASAADAPSGSAHVEVRGVTISCHGWGRAWGTDGFGAELDDLVGLGANWVAIHPYGRIHADGSMTWRAIDVDDPPAWLARPLEESRRRGVALFVKPHIAYWGSPFSWRGAIDFEDPTARARFFADYRRWIVELARATRGAAAFAVGTELDLLIEHDAEWRAIIAAVRAETDAHLTYAANWDAFERVPFWDALDTVGVQGYFPVSTAAEPDDTELARGWETIVERLRAVHERTGKPVVLTELGYTRGLGAASEPWSNRVARGADAARAEELQVRCLRTALTAMRREREWLRGGFLWKWFVGGSRSPDFELDTPAVRGVMRASWTDRD